MYVSNVSEYTNLVLYSNTFIYLTGALINGNGGHLVIQYLV